MSRTSVKVFCTESYGPVSDHNQRRSGSYDFRGPVRDATFSLRTTPNAAAPTQPPSARGAHRNTFEKISFCESLWQGTRQAATCQQGSALAVVVPHAGRVLWEAVERVIPDIRSRAEVSMIGTPLTHARYLRRHRGSYGPALRAGEAMFPGPGTPVPGLFCAG